MAHHCTAVLTGLALIVAPGNAKATTHAATKLPASPHSPAPRHPLATVAVAHRPAAGAAALRQGPVRQRSAPTHAVAASVAPSHPDQAGYAGSVGMAGWNRGWQGDARYDWAAWRASHREIYRLGGYHPPVGGYAYAALGVGALLDAAFLAEQFWIDDPSMYHLPPVADPYRWVRYYNDALLVDIDTNQVVDAVHDIFM